MCGTIQNYNGNKKQKKDNALKRGVLYIKWKNSWCVHCLEFTTELKWLILSKFRKMKTPIRKIQFYAFWLLCPIKYGK